MHHLDLDPCERDGVPHGSAVGQRQAVEHAPGHCGAATAQHLTRALAGVPNPSLHVAGREELGCVDVDDRATGGKAAAPVSTASMSPSPHVSIAWVNTHSPMTLRRNLVAPSTPPSFVKFAVRAASLSTGAWS